MKKCHTPACTNRGDRRFSFERRRFSYAGFIPERRTGKDRRGIIALFQHSDSSALQTINEKWIDCQ